ncbi:MAG: hypothetical protein RLZZ142_2666 [Verrucomicrobiota bacterium]|jgi:hypothetical protein
MIQARQWGWLFFDIVAKPEGKVAARAALHQGRGAVVQKKIRSFGAQENAGLRDANGQNFRP